MRKRVFRVGCIRKGLEEHEDWIQAGESGSWLNIIPIKHRSNATSHLYHTGYINITIYAFIWFLQQSIRENQGYKKLRTNLGNRMLLSRTFRIHRSSEHESPQDTWFSLYTPTELLQSRNGSTLHQFRHFENIFPIKLKKEKHIYFKL